MKGEPRDLVAARLAHARAVKAGDPEQVEATRERYALQRGRWLAVQAREIGAGLSEPLKLELAASIRDVADTLTRPYRVSDDRSHVKAS